MGDEYTVKTESHLRVGYFLKIQLQT